MPRLFMNNFKINSCFNLLNHPLKKRSIYKYIKIEVVRISLTTSIRFGKHSKSGDWAFPFVFLLAKEDCQE